MLRSWVRSDIYNALVAHVDVDVDREHIGDLYTGRIVPI